MTKGLSILLLLLLLLSSHSLLAVESDFDSDGKIIGGEDALRGEFPFMVSVEKEKLHYCGGSIISKMCVLTACHCVIDTRKYRIEMGYNRPKRDERRLTVLAGTTNILKPAKSYQRKRVRYLHYHPKCIKHPTGWIFDVGLMVMNTKFKMLTDVVAVLPLPEFKSVSIFNMTESRRKCIGLGWGSVIEAHNVPNPRLQKVTIQLQSFDTCQQLMDSFAESISSSLRFTPSVQLCTLGANKKDACQGDSGGPIVCDDRDEGASGTPPDLTLVATCSWGIGCAKHNVPGIWARLDVAADWIQEILADPLRGSANCEQQTIMRLTIYVIAAFL